MDYQSLYQFSKRLHHQQGNFQLIMQSVLAFTAQELGASHGCLISFAAKDTVDHIFILGTDELPESRNRDLWEQLLRTGLAGHVYYSQRPMNIRDIQHDPRWHAFPDQTVFPQSGAAIGVPLLGEKQVFGVLLLVKPEVDYFTDARQMWLTEAANVAGEALQSTWRLMAYKQDDTRYRALFEQSLVPIVLTDVNGTIRDANVEACALLGFKLNHLQGVPIRDINLNLHEKAHLKQLSYDEETFFRATLYGIDENEIPTLVRVRRVQIDNETLMEWMLQDISAQMELEQLRRDLTAMVYHDLRGPLSNIAIGLRKLQTTLESHPQPAVRRILDLSERSADQLKRMVDSLLDIQRLDDREEMIDRKPTPIRQLLLDAVEIMQPIARDSGQILRLQTASDLPYLSLDADMMLRVVINLVDNAIKYTPQAGIVRVKAAQEQGGLLVTVSDSGSGIPLDMQKQIFDKFSRVKYKDIPRGIGLGLAFCRLAVEAHGGVIWVESDGQHGSEFKFLLPLEQSMRMTQPAAKITDSQLMRAVREDESKQTDNTQSASA